MMRRMVVSAMDCLFLGLPGMVASETREDRNDVCPYGRLWPKVT